jgi:hypothetical protein
MSTPHKRKLQAFQKNEVPEFTKFVENETSPYSFPQSEVWTSAALLFFFFCSNAPGLGVVRSAGRLRSRESSRDGLGKSAAVGGLEAWTRDLLRGSPRAIPPGHAGGRFYTFWTVETNKVNSCFPQTLWGLNCHGFIPFGLWTWRCSIFFVGTFCGNLQSDFLKWCTSFFGWSWKHSNIFPVVRYIRSSNVAWYSCRLEHYILLPVQVIP